MGQQLLTDQLIERLIRQVVERQQVVAYRPRGIGEQRAVPLEADGVLSWTDGPERVLLCVLPLHQHQLDDTVSCAVKESGINAGAVRTTGALATNRLVEKILLTDVLERQEPTG